MSLERDIDCLAYSETKPDQVRRIAPDRTGREQRSGLNLPDAELIRRLEDRDGPLGSRIRVHSTEDGCRYPQLYSDGECPWCNAERQRQESAWRKRRVA